MKFIYFLSIICLMAAFHPDYGMENTNKAKVPEAKESHDSVSTSAAENNQQDEWAQYLQQEHEKHLKLRIFQTTETILKQFGIDPKKVHVVVTNSDERLTWATDTKTIFIRNELGEESANQNLRAWLLYNVDFCERAIAFFERNSVAIEDLKKTILHINHQVIEDLLNRKEYIAIATRPLELLIAILNGTGRTYPYPTCREEYDSMVQQLKNCWCTIELVISEQSATSTRIEVKFQKILSRTMEAQVVRQEQLSVISVSKNFSLPLTRVYALLYPETYGPTSSSSSSSGSSSSSSSSSSATVATTTTQAISMQNATMAPAIGESKQNQSFKPDSCLCALAAMRAGGRSQ